LSSAVAYSPGSGSAAESAGLPRLRLDEALTAQVIRSLTPRDRKLCEALYEHRVLTTGQLADLAFDTRTRAQVRLVTLYRRRVLDRFRPYTADGSAPFHYVLDTAGAATVAAARGVSPDELGWRAEHALRYADSGRLAHLVGTNGVFTFLARHARRQRDARLAAWWSERRCTAAFGALARPDGYGLWQQGGRRVDFFLEYDTGSEPLARLAGKLPGYRRLFAALDRPAWLLFWLPTPTREANTRQALSGAALRIATAHPQLCADPAGPVWLPLRGDGPRRTLVDLQRTERDRAFATSSTTITQKGHSSSLHREVARSVHVDGGDLVRLSSLTCQSDRRSAVSVDSADPRHALFGTVGSGATRHQAHIDS
jgi:hypothetical protein